MGHAPLNGLHGTLHDSYLRFWSDIALIRERGESNKQHCKVPDFVDIVFVPCLKPSPNILYYVLPKNHNNPRLHKFIKHRKLFTDANVVITTFKLLKPSFHFPNPGSIRRQLLVVAVSIEKLQHLGTYDDVTSIRMLLDSSNLHYWLTPPLLIGRHAMGHIADKKFPPASAPLSFRFLPTSLVPP